MVTGGITKWGARLALAAVSLCVGSQATQAAASTLTIAPAVSTYRTPWPFGTGDQWTPYMGFIYRNIPPFQLKPGDRLGFDEIKGNYPLFYNDSIDIDMVAATVSNGDALPQGPYTNVVPRTEGLLSYNLPDDFGHFARQQTVTAPFNFPGGGLIIRFSHPCCAAAHDYANYNLPGVDSGDPSGYFAGQFENDDDGLPPYVSGGFGPSSGFQLTMADPASPGAPQPTKKKCKKSKKSKHRAASMAKKRCKKKH